VTERVTLITGASAGIGTELARVFASNGHRLALVARRADRLTALAAEIAAAGGAAPVVIPCDLGQPDAGDKIAAALAAEPDAQAFYATLNYSSQRRYVEPLDDAKTDETRARRIAKVVADLKAGKK